METILVPTDFSEVAEKALYYALELARKKNSGLLILNAYTIEYPVSEVAFDVIDEIRRSAKNEAETKLKLLSTKIEQAGSINHELIALEGVPSDIILKTAKNKNSSLIIMGTKGYSTIANQILGSNAVAVIENAQCPVIAVPGNTVFSTIKKITFVTDYEDTEMESIEATIKLASLFGAQVNILHVATEGMLPEGNKAMMKTFMEKINKNTTYSNLSFQILHGVDLEESLDEYLETDPADLLAIYTHRHNFFKRLFRRSAAAHLVNYAAIPVLTFH
jgi:nucleotide-binding universal stress UspA family protein